MSESHEECPTAVAEFAARAVEFVQSALGVTLEFNSETLPVLDHYLRAVPDDQPEAAELVAATAGAYFGEVVRRRLGGSWDASDDDPSRWRFELPGGLWLRPGQMALAAIFHTDEFEDTLNPPARMQPAAEAALARMADVTAETYYSLCGRLDTLEHLHAVMLAVAAREAERRSQAN